MDGKPLIAWTIYAARKPVYIDRLFLFSGGRRSRDTGSETGLPLAEPPLPAPLTGGFKETLKKRATYFDKLSKKYLPN